MFESRWHTGIQPYLNQNIRISLGVPIYRCSDYALIGRTSSIYRVTFLNFFQLNMPQSINIKTWLNIKIKIFVYHIYFWSEFIDMTHISSIQYKNVFKDFSSSGFGIEDIVSPQSNTRTLKCGFRIGFLPIRHHKKCLYLMQH